jgi:Flp pilus assembly protein TadG
MVALSIAALLAFSAFVVDYGIMWVSRSQVQTSADAAALAGATARSFDSDKSNAHVQAVAVAVGKANVVWGATPNIANADVQIAACPPTPGMGADTCVKVDAFRNQTRGNPLPIFFGGLVGVPSQGVRATATARGVAANAANCLKPWAVGDKWLDTQVGGWDQTATYVPTGSAPTGGDSYIPPTATSPGNGFTEHDASGNPTFYGYQMILKLSNPGQGANQIPINSAGWAAELCLDNASTNSPCSTPAYNANITGCTSDVVSISQPGTSCTAVDPTKGCLGVKTGSTGNNNATDVANFIAANDPSATWSDGSGGSWQTGKINTTQAPSSRIVPIAIIDVPEYLAAGYSGSNGIVRVVNIVGFFIEGTCSTVSVKEPYLQCPNRGNNNAAIVGRLVSYPGQISATGGTVIGSFGTVITLVR